MDTKELRDRFMRVLEYNPKTGVFTWTKRVRQRVITGSVAGSLAKDGYLHITFEGKIYKASRIAWLFSYGKWPIEFIDHINGVRDDNRIQNLREVTR